MKSIDDDAPNSLKIVMREYCAAGWAVGVRGYAYRIYLRRAGYPGDHKIGNVRQSLIDMLEENELPPGISLQEAVINGVDFDEPPQKSVTGGKKPTRRRPTLRR